uniref:Armadillo repeat-containing protein 6 homolog n=1 Tax=Cacopsylla melanoneura TaxID=428564 RepID=A0A8D8QMQ5_9HEMI
MSTENTVVKKHIIDQATFDEAVTENIDLLDMVPEEAIESAKTQYISQNVDLSNIITDAQLYGGIDNHPFVQQLQTCIKLSKEKVINEAEIMKAIKSMMGDMTTDKAKNLYVGNNGGYEMGVEILRTISEKKSPEMRNVTKSPARDFANNCPFIEGLEISSIIFLKQILNGYPDLLNRKDVPLFLFVLAKNSVHLRDYVSQVFVRYLLELITNTLVLHETNRELWSNSKLFSLLTPLVTENYRCKYDNLMRLLPLLRAMTLDDDIRVEVPNTHERVRKMAELFLVPLTVMMGHVEEIVKTAEGDDESKFTTLLLRTITSLCVCNEHCASITEHAGLESIHAILRRALTQCLEGAVTAEGIDVAVACMGLIKTIAGNDDVKIAVFKKGLVVLAAHLVTTIDERKGLLPIVQLYENYLLLLSMLTLRHTGICQQAFELGIIETIVTLLNTNITNPKLVKYSAWTLRNICVRHKPAVELVLQTGGDQALQKGLKLHPSIGYDVKCALKELGDSVEVKLEEQWTGKGQMNFNPEF